MKKPTDTDLAISAEYREFIEDLKARVLSARISAARAVTHEAIRLYWDIGRGIVEKQRTFGWGDSVVEMVAADLRKEFPGVRGFSPFNVWRMRQMYLEYSSPQFLAQAVPEIVTKGGRHTRAIPGKAVSGKAGLTLQPPAILEQLVQELLPAVPWGHHVELLKKVKAPAARLWYLRATARLGWTRDVLLNQIKAGAYERAVVEKKTHNFALVLPEHLAEQADEMLKSSYNLEFLGLRRAVRERELEARLISSLQAFILELGYGFCSSAASIASCLGATSTLSICCSTTASSGRWWPST